MKAQHSIAQLCATLGVTDSGYYAWGKAPASVREEQDATLGSKIQALHTRHQGRYGALRIRAALAQQPSIPQPRDERTFLSSRRDFSFVVPSNPAINGWAIFGNAVGATCL
jgi:hypothetical protein